MKPRRRVPSTPEEIGEAVFKMCRYAESLERAVRLLAERVTPVEGENPPEVPAWFCAIPKSQPKTFRDIGALLLSIDASIEGAERHLAAIRANMVQDRDGSYSSADMREWMK